MDLFLHTFDRMYMKTIIFSNDFSNVNMGKIMWYMQTNEYDLNSVNQIISTRHRLRSNKRHTKPVFPGSVWANSQK